MGWTGLDAVQKVARDERENPADNAYVFWSYAIAEAESVAGVVYDR